MCTSSTLSYLVCLDLVLVKGSQNCIDLSKGEFVQKIVKLIERIILVALLVKCPNVKHNFHDLNKKVRLDILKKSPAPGLVRPEE